MTAFAFKDVAKRYRERTVLRNFSLEANAGERLALLGPSGCGKTTVLRLLAGFIAPDDGQIEINGELAAAKGRNFKEPEQRKIGMVFQDLALWPHLSVKGNLEFGLKAQGVEPVERERRVRDVLGRVRLADCLDAMPSELSGGQQQRVALARALVTHPQLLLMDEPLSSLDYELNLRLRREVLELHRQIGFTLLYVTHNLDEAFYLASRIVVMKNGGIERIGLAEDIRAYFRQLRKHLGEGEEGEESGKWRRPA